MCNISQTYLSQIEHNEVEPSLAVLNKIAKELDTSLPLLMYGSLEEADIKESKKHVFKELLPTLKKLIEKFS